MKNNLISFAMLLIIVLAFNNWLLPFHENVSTDLSYNFKAFSEGIEYPWSWATVLTSNGLGVDSTITLWSYPVQVVYQSFLKIGVPFWFQMKYLGLLPILLFCFIGFKLISYRVKTLPLFSLFIYVLNPYFLSIIDGGQLNLAFAYSLIPITISVNLLPNKNKLRYKYLSVILIWITSCFDLRIAIIEIIIIGLILLLKKKIKQLSLFVSITAICLLLWHFYWIAPLIISKNGITPVGYTSAYTASTLSYATLGHAISLQPANWYLNVFGKTENTRWYLYIYPLLAFGVLAFTKNKFIKYIAVVALTGIFLSKGTQEPLGLIYQFLYTHLPGFVFFRDSSKFFMIIAFCYSLLISNLFSILKNKFIKLSYLLLIVCTVIIWPVFTGKLYGTFAIPHLSNEVKNSWKLFANEEFYRSIWYPAKHPLGYSSTNHPSINLIDLINLRPFTTNITGSYESLNFLRSAAVPEILKTASVKYFIFPDTDNRKGLFDSKEEEYIAWLKNYFRSQSWLSTKSTGAVDVYELPEYFDKFRLLKSIAWVVGPDNTYEEFTKRKIGLKNIAVIHVDEYPNLLDNISLINLEDSRIVMNQTDILDVKMSLTNDKQLTTLSSLVSEDNSDPSGWWSKPPNSFIDIRTFLYEKYKLDYHDFDRGKGYLISERKNKIQIPLSKHGSVYARVLMSSESGKLVFKSSQNVTSINTFNNSTVLRWVKVFSNITDKEITVESDGNINILNTISVLNTQEESEIDKKFNDLGVPLVNIDDYLVNPPYLSEKVSWEYVNPTNYTIKNINSNGLLVFSDSYSKKWISETGDKKSESIPIYSYINGFHVNRGSMVEIRYSIQDDVYKFIPISFISMLIPSVIMMLSLLRKRILSHEQ